MEVQQPGRLAAIQNWFRNIKTFDGKKANEIAHNGRLHTKAETIALIASQHNEWKKLHSESDAETTSRRQQFRF